MIYKPYFDSKKVTQNMPLRATLRPKERPGRSIPYSYSLPTPTLLALSPPSLPLQNLT